MTMYGICSLLVMSILQIKVRNYTRFMYVNYIYINQNDFPFGYTEQNYDNVKWKNETIIQDDFFYYSIKNKSYKIVNQIHNKKEKQLDKKYNKKIYY